MNLKKLQAAIGKFKKYLQSPNRYLQLYKWESQKVWQDHWNVHTTDLKKTFDESLQNSETRRLWTGTNYEPKQIMMKFIEMEKEYVRSLFRDLFNEDKDIEGRVDRFLFYCDDLLTEYKQAHPTSIENNHYHGDYKMVALYLAFEYPDNYTLYNFEGFRGMLTQLGSFDIPTVNDLERYFKVMRTVYKFLEKDEELMSLHQVRLTPGRHYSGKSLLLAHEFAGITAGAAP